MNCFKFIKAASQISQLAMTRCAVRAISTTSVKRDCNELIQFKKKQAHFQAEDGRPIFLKSGFMDRILYMTTVTLAVIGLLNVFWVVYNHAKPASWREQG